MKGIELKKLRKKHNVNQDELAKAFDLTRKTISLYENTEVPEDRSQAIIEFFEKYNNLNVTKSNILNNNTEIEIKSIPFYDVDFYSGFTQIFNDQTIQPSYHFYLPEFHEAQFAVKNSGKSMAKELGTDDILGLKQVDDWKVYFPEGEIYAVVTSNGFRTVKRVRYGKDKETLMLIPKPLDEDRFDYPEFEEVPKEMVIALFKVVATTHSKKLTL